MLRQDIAQGWTLQIQGEEERIPAQVPGSVYNDLLCSKRMEDPFWRDNEDKALKLMEKEGYFRITGREMQDWDKEKLEELI